MRKAEREANRETKEAAEIIEVGEEGMLVGDLAELLAVNATEVVKTLFLKGVMCSVNQVLDIDAVKLVAESYEVEVLEEGEKSIYDEAKKVESYDEDDGDDDLLPRAPVVCVMGHVDHGKTSLLDYMRKASVADGEAGGITQGIGAYRVDVEGREDSLVFLDTPGHEAFSSMRARGARVTDVAIVVVAADDGVMPQTKEAISHAQAAEVPIVIAYTKSDKSDANLDRVRTGLSEIGVVDEAWGGDFTCIPVSSKTGEGIPELLESVMLVAELEELKANPNKLARGTVLEANLDKTVGAKATVLVQTGTLRIGDNIVSGASFGKVRSMMDDRGNKLEEAGPSTAVQITGWGEVPVAGATFEACETDAEMRAMAEASADENRLARLAERAGGRAMSVSLTALPNVTETGELTKINVVLRTDASGSVEAVKAALDALPQDSVALRYLFAAPGEIAQSDVDLATASEGIILGFNVQPSDDIQSYAKDQGVEIRTYDVIYNLIDDVRAAMEGKLLDKTVKDPLGSAKVLAVFGSGKRRAAGCSIEDGLLRKGCTIEVKRKKRVVYEGVMDSLRKVREDVFELEEGNECGVQVEKFWDWKEGDRIFAYQLVTQSRTLEQASEEKVVVVSSTQSMDDDDDDDE